MDVNNYNRCKEKYPLLVFSHSWNEISVEFLDVYKSLCEF